MHHRFASVLRLGLLAVMIVGLLFPPHGSAYALTTLTVSPLTWNVIGLDSNNVNVGPNDFPVGARVCNTSTAGETLTGITATFALANTNPYVSYRPGTSQTYSGYTLAPGACVDFYFEVEVTRTASAYDTTEQYTITVDSNETSPLSTPQPRELYVEHLVSQSRNAVTDVQFGTSLGGFTPVAAGGTMDLMVGNTYYIKLIGFTATQGYEQLESFINIPNTIFQILSVSSTYDHPTDPYTIDKLYSDACAWENNPTSPNYRACTSTGKSGGNIAVTYQVRILQVPSTPLVNPAPLSTLVYDFSGSSFHYNSDYGVSTRYANIINASLTKSFSPKTILPGGTSTLMFTITNPGPTSISSVSFTDTLPSGLTIATSSSTQCSGTLTTDATTRLVSLSGATVAGNSTCTFGVSVSSSTNGPHNNITNHLFIGPTDTGSYGSDTLIVNSQPSPPSSCSTPTTLATWTLPTSGQGSGGPPPPYTTKASNVSTATVSSSGGTFTIVADGSTAANSWSGAGWPASGTPGPSTAPYFQFILDTSNYGAVTISFDYLLTGNGDWASASNNFIYVHSQADSGAFSSSSAFPTSKGSWQTTTAGTYGVTFAAPATGTSTTTFRINAAGAQNTSAEVRLDDVTFTGCARPTVPTMSKSFSPISIATGSTSTLQFVLTNPNATVLNGVSFTDVLPSGLSVANGTFSACGGKSNLITTAATRSISLSGGTIAASGTCTINVTVTGTASGSYTNTSTNISSTDTGPNTSTTANVGFGQALLTVIDPPVIAKSFTANPIFTGNTTTLNFTIDNPNTSTALSGISFTDTLPAGLDVTNSSSPQCGGTLTLTNNAPAQDTVSLSGGSLGAGGNCTFNVTVTGTTTGLKTNSVTVSSSNGGTGNTSIATVLVKNPTPAINLLKQVSSSASGPWMPYLTVTTGANVYYRFIVENVGDVALTGVSVNDPTVSPLTCSWPSSLPIADASNNQIATCVLGPVVAVSGSHTNTATATFSGATPSDEPSSSATYATLTIDKDTSTPAITPNGIVVYTVAVVNSGDMDLTNFQVMDTLPDFNGATAGKGYSVTSVTAPGYTVNGAFDGSSNINLLAGTDALAGNTAATITITLTLSNATPGTYDNTATAFTDETDSVRDDGLAADDPGTPGSGADPETDEDVAVFEASPTKSVVRTSEPSTGSSSGTELVTIGEMVRYRLVTMIPQGSFTNLQLVDGIPNGFQFLNDNTATVAFVCNGGAACMTSSTLSGAGLIISGSSGAVSPTLVLPGSAISGGPFISDTDVTFSLGNITNSDSDVDSEYIVVEFNALVLNVNTSSFINQGVDNDPLSPTAGDSNGNFRPNNVALRVNGSQVGATSPNVTVWIAEPAITSITKSVTPATGPYLPTDALTYTLSFSNNATGNRATTAFDLVLTDTFDANLTLGTVNVSSTQGATCAGGNSFSTSDSTVGQLVTVNISCLDPGSSVTVTVNATIDAGTTSGATLSNTGSLTYTSLPGTQGNCATAPFSCSGVGGAGSVTGERNGSGGSGADTAVLNNYAATSNTVNSTVAFGSITITKDVVPDDAQDFTFAGSGPGGYNFAGGFSLDDDADGTLPNTETFNNLVPGSYSVTETGLLFLNWSLTGLTCADPDGGSTTDLGFATATIDLDAGENVSCTFTNTGQLPDLSLAKTNGATSVIAGGTTTYTLTVTNSGSTATTAPITIFDVLPTGLNIPDGPVALSGAQAASWTCSAASNVITCASSTTIEASGGTDTSAFSFMVNVDATASGTVINKAQVGGGDPTNPPPTSTTAGTCTGINMPIVGCAIDADTVSNPSFTIMKDADVFDVDAAGDLITYTVILTNTGDVTLTGVSVIDPLLANLDCDGVAGTPFIATGLSIPVPGALTCTGTYTVTQNDIDTNGGGDGLINNTVTGSTNETGSQTASEIVEILQAPGLTIAKSVTETMYSMVGSVLHYSFLVTNSGNVTLSGPFTVTDDKSTDETCPVGATLAPGAGISCTATYTVTQADLDAGSVTNIASAHGSFGGNAVNSGTDTETVNATQNPALNILKALFSNADEDGSLDVSLNDTLTYTVTATNTGNTTLTSVVVSDTLITPSSNTCATVAPNATCVLTGTYVVTQADVDNGQINNTGSVTDDDVCTTACDDPNTVPVPQNPDLTISKTETSSGPYILGDTIMFNIVVTNTGNVTLTNVDVTDNTATLGVCSPSLPAGSLAPLATITCAASHVVTQADVDNGSYSNNASVTDGDVCPAAGTATCDSTVTIPVNKPLIGISKRVIGKTEVSPGTWDVTYELFVENFGSVALNGIQVLEDLTVTFPVPTTFIVQSVTSNQFTKNPGYNGNTTTDLLTGADSLAIGANGRITLVVRVQPHSAGPFNNIAIASGQCLTCLTPVTDNSQDGANPDPDSDNDPTDNNVSTPVDFGPNLFDPPFGLKTFDPSGLPVLQWTMVWINNSNIVAVNAQVSDPIVAGTTFIPGSLTCTPASGLTSTTSCTYDAGTNRVIWSGTLGPDLGATDGATANNEITITFRVNVAAGITSVQNVATIDSDLNGNLLVTDPGEQQVSTASVRWTSQAPATASLKLPATGFAPNVVSDLRNLPQETYLTTGGVTLEIPSLGINIPIVGVPKKNGAWNVSWLGDQAGWLEGTAFPSWSGNSVLTGHVYNSTGLPGPFVNLNKLQYGDQIIIHAYGQNYIFEVRSNEVVEPNDRSVMKHEEKSWLTLVTCKDYDEKTNTYKKRVVVRAVLVKVTTK